MWYNRGMNVKFKLRPNTILDGWVAEPYEISDPDLNDKVKYSVMFGSGYGPTKELAIAEMKQRILSEKENLIKRAKREAEGMLLTEEREIEI